MSARSEIILQSINDLKMKLSEVKGTATKDVITELEKELRSLESEFNSLTESLNNTKDKLLKGLS